MLNNIHTYIYMCMYTYIYIYMYMYTCIYSYAYQVHKYVGEIFERDCVSFLRRTAV
jgi:hypothetical protein